MGNCLLSQRVVDITDGWFNKLPQDIADQECDTINDYYLSTADFLDNVLADTGGHFKDAPGGRAGAPVLFNALAHLFITGLGRGYEKHGLAQSLRQLLGKATLAAARTAGNENSGQPYPLYPPPPDLSGGGGYLREASPL